MSEEQKPRFYLHQNLERYRGVKKFDYCKNMQSPEQLTEYFFPKVGETPLRRETRLSSISKNGLTFSPTKELQTSPFARSEEKKYSNSGNVFSSRGHSGQRHNHSFSLTPAPEPTKQLGNYPNNTKNNQNTHLHSKNASLDLKQSQEFNFRNNSLYKSFNHQKHLSENTADLLNKHAKIDLKQKVTQASSGHKRKTKKKPIFFNPITGSLMEISASDDSETETPIKGEVEYQSFDQVVKTMPVFSPNLEKKSNLVDLGSLILRTQ